MENEKKIKQPETEEALNEPSYKKWSKIRPKIIAMSIASIINGALYFSVATEGGSNIETFFNLSGYKASVTISTISFGASLVYTMFTYKTLESLSLKINSTSKLILSFLAPFSAAAFLTAGTDGATLLHFDSSAALSIGVALFALRMINCIDASVKFPDRLIETKNAWLEARNSRDYKEIARLIVIGFVSIGYVACTTDAIYSASNTILGWFNTKQNIIEPISYIASIIGALGTLPLIVYWSHRGLRQLTFGGKTNMSGENPDPTDKYTYIGLLLVIPVMLGILGAATTSTGAVFGQLGVFSQFIRVTTSILYATCAGTPGMATLLRNISGSLSALTCCTQNNPEKYHLLGNSEEKKRSGTATGFNLFDTQASDEKIINESATP